MKQKLSNLIDGIINGVDSIIKSPYRIISFGIFAIFAMDIVNQASKGPLNYSIDKLVVITKALQSMGFDILLLVVLLTALIVHITKK